MGTQTLPLSIREEKPRPEGQEFFGTQFLQVFIRYTRKLYALRFGSQAPPFNLSASTVKYWWDSAAATLPPDDVYMFKYLDRASDPPVLRTMVITNRQACQVSIPGLYDYPEYVVMPTRAFVQGPDGNATGLIPATRLSYFPQAEALYAKIREDLPGKDWYISEDSLDGMIFRYVYGITDTEVPENNFKEGRRIWSLALQGKPASRLNVGRMFGKMNRDGVGAPGHFILRGEDSIVWVSDLDLQDPTETLPEVPIPCRDLAADEKLVKRSPFDVNGSVQIIEPGGGEPGGGDFSEKIWNLLKVVAERIGIIVE
jgi:hypothetical protein